MSTFRVNKNVNYTVMSNHHLQDKRLSLKAKGLLSYMLSLPDDWDYSLKGLTTGCRDGIDSVRSAVHELEDGGYLCRSKVRDARGRIIDYNYEVFELPQKERIEKRPAPVPNSPSSENPMSGFPTLENPTQQNTNSLLLVIPKLDGLPHLNRQVRFKHLEHGAGAQECDQLILDLFRLLFQLTVNPAVNLPVIINQTVLLQKVICILVLGNLTWVVVSFSVYLDCNFGFRR